MAYLTNTPTDPLIVGRGHSSCVVCGRTFGENAPRVIDGDGSARHALCEREFEEPEIDYFLSSIRAQGQFARALGISMTETEARRPTQDAHYFNGVRWHQGAG